MFYIDSYIIHVENQVYLTIHTTFYTNNQHSTHDKFNYSLLWTFVMIIKLAGMRSRLPAALETAAFACHRVFGDSAQVDALPGMTQSTTTTTTYSYMA